ncbi:pyrroline-5-carboxylate reductase 3-like [Dendronephthya gigantea]|uniref:pyrroline-5-carboxylate reductase 3-like n=1 Tax=Dendronephthya gigantea TaxID=151771 RepID=UPI001069F4E3|nr:pyrroline-5-carboxylate reductase 3-like [Dendronephthya gigantea]
MAGNVKVGFIGGGKMAQAIASGFLLSGLVKPSDIIASAATEKTLNIWKEWGCVTSFSNKRVVDTSQMVFIGVKPHLVLQVLKEIHDNVTGQHIIVSVANGITTTTFEKSLPVGTSVIRTLPNMPCAVQAGMTAFCRGKNASDADVTLLDELLVATGVCKEVKEDYLDIISAVSGSGPAYIYIMISALADGAVKCGLPRDLAQLLAANMVGGAAKMVTQSGKHPDQLKDEICSPGGSTIAAIHEMEKNCFRGTVISAVEAAVNKSKAAGRDNK